MTRRSGSSLRCESAKARCANLLAEYEARPGEDVNPAPELMNTTWPRAARSGGSSANVSATAPVTLTSNVFRHCCGVDSANRPG